MSREIYISSTPHETRLAIVEKDELSEIYYERENEYTLAGSIYNGRVTRVLPGMQSAFVDVGLERDAFLYITDFMEEQGDSADFESSEGRSGKREKSRGRRDEENSESAETPSETGAASESDRRRGDRNRNDRGRRGEQRDAAPREDHSRDQSSFASHAEGDADDAADGVSADTEDGSAPEGSRRWRGRRGRRRGRSGNEEVRSDGTGSETTCEISVDAVAATPEAKASDAPREEHSERFGSRHEGRGRNDKRRGRDFGRDRGSYGRQERSGQPDAGQVADASPAAEPFILPGESLSKYRRGDDADARREGLSSTRTQPVSTFAAKPSTEAAAIVGWDGGLTLPGETLSRHSSHRTENIASEDRSESFTGNVSGRDRRKDRDRKRGFAAEGEDSLNEVDVPHETHSVDASLPAFRSRSEQEPPAHPQSGETHVFEFAQAEARSKEAEGPVAAQTVYEAETDAAPTNADPAAPEVLEAVEEFHEVVAEYEPGDDASASYRVDPAGPSEFRQSSPVLEGDAFLEAEREGGRETAESPEGAEVEHEFTLVQDSGEMLSELPEPVDAAVAPHDAEKPTAPIQHEEAVHSIHLATAEAQPLPGVFAPGVFAPGEGELEEELLDDEDSEPLELHAGAFEDTEEETLENAADLGVMIREMSIDQITQPEAADDEDEDDFDFDEGELEEDELEANGEEAEDFAGSDVSESEEEDFAEAAEFDGDETSESPAAEVAPQRESRSSEERRGKRDVRRGRERGNRRGMANSRPGGRPGRHSVQATDLPAISDLLKPGQEVLVQIAKEPIAKKGARITSHIALPGRFLVFMPTVNHVGVSRKIESDGERRRLKEILLSEKGEASGGFIVRTAASGASEEELRSDLRFLLNLWADIKQRSEGSKSPALIYHDLNLVERILRDQVSDSFSAIWVDTEAEYERVLRFLQRFQPSLLRRVKLYTKETPLFEQFGITNEINKALRSKVWLKSGGSIVINQTEALVAIDINTGKYVGKTARLEDTIVKTNLDAIPEIVRQIRLRDLGGIIIIDFIDMDERKNRQKVMQVLEEELKKDRAPSKVLQFNDFGLVAITRKRVKQSLERTLSTTCAICTGTGMVKAPVTVCNEIYVELRKMHKHLDKGDVMLRVNPDVVKQLKSNNGKWLQEMEEISGRTILVKSDPGLHPEQFDIQ